MMICELCKSSSIKSKYYLQDLKHKTTDGKFLLKECKVCNLYLIEKNNSPENMSKYYPENYSAFQTIKPSRKNTDKSYNNFVVKGRLAWSEIIGIDPAMKILDVGCGSGNNIHYLKSKFKAKYVGIEPNLSAVNEGRRYGLNIIHGKIEEFEPQENFDIIYMLHVIEHIDNPLDSLKKIYKLLAPDGKLVIGTPNAKSLERIIFKQYWDAWDTPRHKYIFNSSNIKDLLIQAGFTNISVHYEVYSLFHRSMRNIYKCKNRKMGWCIYLISSRFNKVLMYLLPFLKSSSAIQIIAEKSNSND